MAPISRRMLGSILFLMALSSCGSIPPCRTGIEAQGTITGTRVQKLNISLLNEHQQGHFDGMISITEQSRPLLQQAYGCAIREPQQINTLKTLSDIGSIAKTFTAAAIMRLIEQQQLELQSPLQQFFPGLPEDKQQITVEQLLTHTSGLENFHSRSDFEKMSKTEALTRIKALDVTPISDHSGDYSNAGYTLLAMIIEQVSHRSFQTYVQQEILDRLGLKHTGFYRDIRLKNQTVAVGYRGNNAGINTYEQPFGWAIIGSGGMFSNINDLNRWVEASKQQQLLSPTASQQNLSPSANKLWTYGHWRLKNYAGKSVREAGGSTDYGYTAMIQYTIEDDLLVIAVLNGYTSEYGHYTHHAIVKDTIDPILFEK